MRLGKKYRNIENAPLTMNIITKQGNSRRTAVAKSTPAAGLSETPIQRLDEVMRTLLVKGISTKMLHAITTLYLKGRSGMSMGELSSSIGVSSAAFTSVANDIERLGFARRTSNANDRRSTYFKLTDNGLTFVEWISSSLDSDAHPHPAHAD